MGPWDIKPLEANFDFRAKALDPQDADLTKR